MTISDLQLLKIQVEALFTHDPDGRIRSINEPGGGPAPRFFLGRTREGNLWRVRYDLPSDVVRDLEALAADEPVTGDLRAEPRNLVRFQAALGDEQGTGPVEAGPAYRFPAELPAVTGVTRITPANVSLVEAMGRGWEGFAEELPAREPCWAVIEDGIAVSVSFSARLTARAAEAGAETLSAYRGRGYAGSVVAAWADEVRRTGRMPLYSTSWENLASQAVARKLGLTQYGTDLSL